MAYEIFWPMRTFMEKKKNFEKLENSIICEEFKKENKSLVRFCFTLGKYLSYVTINIIKYESYLDNICISVRFRPIINKQESPWKA